MIIGRPFKLDDLEGVISCLKQSYLWMQEKTDEEIKKWLMPLYDHTWKDNEIIENKYPYGKVLEENGRIIGYLGAIGYKRTVEGQKLDFLNLTTWAVDKGARGGFLSVAEDLYEKPDVIIDLTPNKASVLFGRKFFKMESYEDSFLRLLPVPYMGDSNLNMEWINVETEINEEQIRKEYINHKDYNDIVLTRANGGNRTCYLFYKRMSCNGSWIRVLKVSDPSFFAMNCHEIVWHIFDHEFYSSYGDTTGKFSEILRRSQEREWICMECDKRFFDNNNINYPRYSFIRANRMYRNNTRLELGIIDHLYTEFAVLI